MDDAIILIGKRLGIQSYSGELPLQYLARIAYSAISCWILEMVSSDLHELEDGLMYYTKTKVHRDAGKVLASFLAINQSLNELFYPSENSDPINIIREPLLKGGILIDVGFQSQIALAKEMQFMSSGLVYKATGLCPNLESDNKTTILSFLEHLNIDEDDYAHFLKRYVDNAKWEKIIDDEKYEYFDVHNNQVFSNCWKPTPPKGSDEVFMARKQLSYGVFEYKLMRFKGETLLYSILSEFAQNESVRETQRLLYSLKAVYGIRAHANIERKEQYSIWHFWSKLPPAMDIFLRLIGWPLETIENKKNEYVIRNEYYDLVSRLAKRLGIEEIRNE